MKWGDIAIHAALTAGIVALVAARPPLWIAALIVAAGWAVREALQDRAKHGAWRSPADWSTQKHLEWAVALAAGLALAALLAS